MSKKGMTLDNTARVDQSVRAGKVWKSPASSKPTYVVKATTASVASEVHIPLQGEFRVLDAWFLKVTGNAAAGDVIGVAKGKPSASGASIWEFTAAGAVNANSVVRTDAMDRTKVAGVGDLGDNADTNGLWVFSDDAGGGDTAAVVCVLVELDA
tara:strand:- start:67 stop:528 length:462 start_codon:yes stop_codon:yes gene_type:complete